MTAVIDWLGSVYDAQPLHVSLQITGVIGSVTYVGAFFLVQSGRICGNAVSYPCMQIFAAGCVLASLTTAFNLAAFVIQVSFILIALYGIWYRVSGRLSARLDRSAVLNQGSQPIEIAHLQGPTDMEAPSAAPANLQLPPLIRQADGGGMAIEADTPRNSLPLDGRIA